MSDGPLKLPVKQLDLRFATLRLTCPAQMTRLRRSVQVDGIQQPVLVSYGVQEACAVLLDGFKRVRLAEELGFGEVWAHSVHLDAAQSKAAMVRRNLGHRGLSDIEEAWIVRSLCREHTMTQAAVGALLGHDKSWVCRRLKLAEQLEESLQEDIRLGLLSSTVARELCRLPRGNQLKAAQTVREHGLTSRQIAQLTHLVLQSDDPQARRALLDDPMRYIAAASSSSMGSPTDPRLSPGANHLRRILLRWDGTSTRLLSLFQQHAPAGLHGEDSQSLAPLLGQTLQSGRRSLERIEQCWQESGLPTRSTPLGHA